MATLGEYIGAGSGTTKLLLHLNGNSTDASGNGNNGTDTNITYGLGYGKFGQGAYFRTDTTVPSITTPLTDEARTISLWFTGVVFSGGITSGTMEWGSLINQRTSDTSGWTIRRGGNTNNLYIKIGGTDYKWNNVDNGFFDGTWRHIVLVKDGSNTKMYTNGALTYTISGVVWSSSGINVEIGNDAQVDNRHHGGNIDEVIIENRAWTASEVRKYFTMGKGRFGL